MDLLVCFVFQAEDGIRDLVRSRGLGDVYKRQREGRAQIEPREYIVRPLFGFLLGVGGYLLPHLDLSLIHI